MRFSAIRGSLKVCPLIFVTNILSVCDDFLAHYMLQALSPTMRRLQPVVWAKGTFLSPQHLQAQDIFHEDLLQFRIDSLNPFPWGFRSITLNREALAGGHLAIDKASGILPDGLAFDIPESDPAPLPKPL